LYPLIRLRSVYGRSEGFSQVSVPLEIFSFGCVRFEGIVPPIPLESFATLYFLKETKHPTKPHFLVVEDWKPEARLCYSAK
jgi:hypothetical protein